MRKILIALLGILLVSSVAAISVEQQVRVTVLPGEINVYSPFEGAVYNNRMVYINLSMSSVVSYFKYKDNGNRLRTLCRNCSEYGMFKKKRKPFDDGFHHVTIFALFETGNVTEEVNFVVDSKDPKIKKTEPRNGFATGLFSVEFQEANPVSLWLNYGNDITGWRNVELDVGKCWDYKRNRKKCSVEVDLTDYDLQEIKFWFNITDILGNTDENKPKKIDVDVSKPVINYFNYTRDGRYVTFLFNITELNFDEINYIDYADRRPRFRRLCSRLRNGQCVKRKSFRRGEHNVSIEVRDEAGNSDIEEISFVVDY